MKKQSPKTSGLYLQSLVTQKVKRDYKSVEGVGGVYPLTTRTDPSHSLFSLWQRLGDEGLGTPRGLSEGARPAGLAL